MLRTIKRTIGFIGLSAIIMTPAFLGSRLALAASSTSDSMMNNLQQVAGPSYASDTDEDTLLDNIAGIIKTVLSLLGFIFVVLMIYAGILWMTAAGNEKQVEKAKSIISRAVTGLIIVVLAYAITYFIFANLPGSVSGGGGGGVE